MIRTIVADDHALIRQGLVRILGEVSNVQVVGEAANGEQAVQQGRVGVLSLSGEILIRIRGKNVLVVNTKLEYGLGRMIAGMLGKDVPEERQICFSIHEALEWLRPGQADELQQDYLQRTKGND